jgi:hypothetical protein
MTKFPDPIRSRLPSGENRFSLVDPLVASYLEFVAERTRPNTFDGPRPEPLARIWREGFEIGGYLRCQVVTQSRNSVALDLQFCESDPRPGPNKIRFCSVRDAEGPASNPGSRPRSPSGQGLTLVRRPAVRCRRLGDPTIFQNPQRSRDFGRLPKRSIRRM